MMRRLLVFYSAFRIPNSAIEEFRIPRSAFRLIALMGLGCYVAPYSLNAVLPPENAMITRGLFTILLIGLTNTSRAADDGWIEMFNGKDLTDWIIDGPTEYKDKADGNKAKPLWIVEDKMIRTAGLGFGFLRYDKQFTDFVYHVEYRMVKGGNSGLGVRTTVFDPKQSMASRPSFYSYEIQLLDDSDKSADKHSTCSLYRYVAPTAVAHEPAPEWNVVEVECIGPKIRVTMNGEEVLNVDQTTAEEIKNKPLTGYVCIQSHSKQVEFRNLKIKELKK